MTIMLRRFRIGMVVLSSVSVDLMGVYYGIAATHPPYDHQLRQQGQGEPYRLLWQDWFLIVVNVLIYIAYILSLRDRRFIKNEYIRAGVMSLLAILLIALSGDLVVQLRPLIPGRRTKMFECHVEDPVCYLRWSSLFVDMIKACFVMIEVQLTLRMGPLEPKNKSSTAEQASQDHADNQWYIDHKTP
ncbi:hypothetical protein B0O80DRAFT_500484 [Mortierella sp. GBAus27b]|nr:hypothetical protein BGX31_001177 [Mortierella sp. GBA43]KAI8350679.1 hypothetical protein B0O80DRAFT_500484 [Mortierella sp. GBAus27b]